VHVEVPNTGVHMCVEHALEVLDSVDLGYSIEYERREEESVEDALEVLQDNENATSTHCVGISYM
jgi:hypothetical protein